MGKLIPAYTGVFLDTSDVKTLRAWFEKETGQELLGVAPPDPHLTVAYRPSVEEVQAMPLGRGARLTVVGWAADEKAQVVLVKGYPSDRKHPHITLAVSPGTQPLYSNTLLLDAPVHPANGPTVEGKIGYVTDGKVFFEFVPPPPPRPVGVDKQTQRLVYDLKPGRVLEVLKPSGEKMVATVSEKGVTLQQIWMDDYTESVEEFRDRVLNGKIRLRRLQA